MHDVPKAALRKAVRGPDTGAEEDEKKANNATYDTWLRCHCIH